MSYKSFITTKTNFFERIYFQGLYHSSSVIFGLDIVRKGKVGDLSTLTLTRALELVSSKEKEF